MKTEKQYHAISSILNRHKEGASIDEIKKELEFDLAIRTLQRRLSKMKELGMIITSGESRDTRYHLTPTPLATENKKGGTLTTSTELIQFSTDSKEILSIVSLPENKRTPVGYNRRFLETYRPNKDSYLSTEEKEKLHSIGKTGKDNYPAGTYAREILNRLLIDLSWNSSRLEGNTYSLLDTERLIHEGKAPENKSAMETQMILNHKDAIEFIVHSDGYIGFNRYTILNLHALLSNNLLPDPAASGRLRKFGVGIGRSVFTPLAVPQLIDEMFDMILSKASQIEDPFEQAFFALVHFPYLQAFDDVNKCVSRLSANIPLNEHNLAPISFIDVPEDLYISGMLGVYELNRVELLKEVFIWAYERSSLRYSAIRQSLGEPDSFRLKYREPLLKVISEIIDKSMDRDKANEFIRQKAKELPEMDQNNFIDTVEAELLGLHEGNFARYRIRPQAFLEWQKQWKQR